MCRSLASSAAVQKRVEAILANPDHPMFMSALRWASEHGYGKPTQPVEGAVSVTLGVVRRSE